MPRFRVALAAVLVIGGALGYRHLAEGTSAADTSRSEAAASQHLDDEHKLRRVPPTSTTAAPAPPTTAAPTPPPAPAPAPAPRPVAPAPAPPPPPPPAPAPVTAADSEARALQLLNDERARNGLPALALNSGARSVARSWSGYMATHSLAHNPNLGRDLEQAGVTGWRTIKENVGYGASADQIHAMLMGSGGHRSIMLSSEVSEVGIGVVNSGGTLWLTMDFIGW